MENSFKISCRIWDAERKGVPEKHKEALKTSDLHDKHQH